MGWQRLSIDLSTYPKKQWSQRSFLQLCGLLLSLLVSLSLALIAQYYALDLSSTNQQKQQQAGRWQQIFAKTETEIELRKSRLQQGYVHGFTTQDVELFLQLLRTLPIQGGIELAQLQLAEKTQIKLIGKLAQAAEFKLIEQQLKQHNMPFNVEHFQTNDKHQLEFVLTVMLKELGNEN